ncbi:MAG: hypothetical protein WAV67_11330 [Dokdonella sp.]
MSLFRYSAAAFVSALIAVTFSSAQAAAPVVIQAAHHDESRPMRDILAELPVAPEQGPGSDIYVVPNIFPKQSGAWQSEFIRALAQRGIQDAPINVPAPTPSLSVLGLVNGSGANGAGGSIPPDTNGDVSPIHYIQWLNTRWAIFDRVTGVRLTASAPGNSFFAGFPGKCSTSNSGDPIALWDDQARRWMVSQFTTGTTASQCFAISTTEDPLGTYYRYEYIWGSNIFGDYPHIGIWTDASGKQDAYTMVTHEFTASGTQSFLGAAFTAFDRDKMLTGQPAAMVRFGGQDAYGALPLHMEGQFAAPAGACPAYVHFDASAGDYLFWDVCLDWATPGNAALTTMQRVAANMPFVTNANSVPQLGTTTQLDTFGANVMYRASARAFPPGAPHAMSMVLNHEVEAGAGQSGIRWVNFDLRKSTDSFAKIFAGGFDVPAGPVSLVKSISEEGVFAPTSDWRWMGSANIDSSGNIGLGYSVSSSTLNPKLRVTGRTPTDPVGMMRDEQDCTPATTGSQTGLFSGRSRWGDYASMSVDPTDECTFMFTSEYHAVTSSGSWSTRICSFKFPDCGMPSFGLASETPTRVEMCGTTAAADPSWRILAGSYNGFSSPVTLSVIGSPAGTTPSFSVNPISPAPGLSTLTLTNGRSIPSGEFAFSVQGVSVPEARTLPLEFGISATAPTAPALNMPTNNATGVKVRPTFTWSAVPGTLTYKIDVASDMAFTTIVASATVTGTTWASNLTLASTTQYYWRVTPANYCGNGAVSATRTFTTGAPGVCPSGTTKSTVYQDDFEIAGTWTVSGTGGSAWTRSTAAVGNGLTTMVYGIPNNEVTSDQSLTSQAVAIPATASSVILSYDVFHSFETDPPGGCWDGASLEMKLGAGTFDVVPDSAMFTDGYNGTITAGSPRAGTRAWCVINSPLGLRSIVDLDAAVGQGTAELRFRASSDSNTAATAPNGMAIDNLKVDVCTPIPPVAN